MLLLAACGWKTDLPVPDPLPVDMSLPDEGPDLGMCIPFQSIARLAALDIFIVSDASGSMDDPTSEGIPKAEAVTRALSDFFLAEGSAGVGAGLMFFPIREDDVPQYCVNDRDCGRGGCQLAGACRPADGPAYLCRDDADCAGDGVECAELGRCLNEDNDLCLPSRGCGGGVPCVDYGFCNDFVTCDVSRYAQPAVNLGELPGRADALIAALEAQPLIGGTPTLAALDGAILRARTWRAANPGSKVIVLLATDGFPTLCDPDLSVFEPQGGDRGIQPVADVAAAGAADGIETFVVGVFTSVQEVNARQNLGAIAFAGGTDDALIITTDEPVTERLLEAFEEVREQVRTCIYAVPAPGRLPDPDDLGVTLIGDGGARTPVRRVAGPDACGGTAGGYFFEPRDDDDARPGFLELCPVSCAVAATDEVAVEMSASCP